MEKLLSQNINRLWSSLIIDEFLKNDITHFYLSPGMRNAPLIAALSHLKKFYSELQVYVCMDERAAAYRALGHSKATGKPSVMLCTSGSAMANYMPALVEAKKSNIALIVLSADRPSELTFCDDNQTIDQVKFFGDYIQGEMNLGTPTVEISPLVLTSSLSNLIHKSLFPQKGPVHINCAFREPLEDTIVPLADSYIALANTQINRKGPSTKYVGLETSPSLEVLNELAETFAKTKRGLLVIGSLNPHESTTEVLALVKKLGWPTYFDVSSSLKYSMNLQDGALPTFDHPEMIDTLVKQPPETVFHIGGRLTSKHYYAFLKKVPDINLITLSLNKEKEDPSHHTKVRLNAHINSTLKQLLHLLNEKKIEGSSELALDFSNFTTKKIDLIDNAPLSYPVISKTIIDRIADKSFLYIGNSTVVRSFDAYFSQTIRKDITVATNRGASGIEGFIASSCGFIDGVQKDVTLIVGDVAFIHDLNSLLFIKDLKHALKIIVVNNDGGGIFTLLPINKEKDVLDYITSPHGMKFDKITRAFDIDYLSASTKEELIAGLDKLEKSKTSALLEIFIDHETNKKVYDQLKTIKL
jgi:2-succinyl-5-enolpyruvyl-6-hydroxy-3-cyclohexene-1-carboxylate synthase